MLGYKVTTVKLHRGSQRVWLEGQQEIRAGFKPGTTYSRKIDADKKTVILELDEDGTYNVSSRTRNNTTIPVIDLNNKDMSIFAEFTVVRVIFKEGKIYILPLASEVRAAARINHFHQKLKHDIPIEIGSFTAGIGVLDLAIHTGLENSGNKPVLRFMNEIREDCIEHSVVKNKAVNSSTVLLNAPLQELAFDSYVVSSLPKVDGIVCGLPCSGASRAGATKLKLGKAEDHPEVGGLIAPFLSLIGHLSPTFIVFENVVMYQNTASMSIMRSTLRDLGYQVYEVIMSGRDFNALEDRERMCMVALTKGLPELQFSELEKPKQRVVTFGEIMEHVPLDDKSWSTMDYLKQKECRDKLQNKGFSMTLLTPESTKLATMNKTMAKRQSTGNYVLHPHNPDLQRLPTIREHAAAKLIPYELVEDVTQTFGHEVLGQSIIFDAFVSVGKLIGQLFNQVKQNHTFHTTTNA